MKSSAWLGVLALVVTCLGFGTCGSSHTSYSYEFSESSGCSTSKTFSTLVEMCAALQSSSLNQDCALAARMTFFQSHCTGTFQSAP